MRRYKIDMILNVSLISFSQICICKDDEDLSVEPVELSVNPEQWSINPCGLMASYRQDDRVNLCHLDWEWVKEKQLEKLQADVILAAGGFSIIYFHTSLHD